MKELNNIEFFQLKQSAKREKNIGKLLRRQFEKRKAEAKAFEQKVKRIKQLSGSIKL